ncbi:tRNA epoxyqueuosine(34) reductase QueG [Halomicronema sp. CCY15110]|uniref:tRNA epoxyqueuosine(34) reductase QueG n=1 Tax=Halomicronema sp. CCY15110 TaxID=2767773 RepID=UPI002815C8C8|nr:tRNA epoxyqueuosine(34) reductase QueG [Halomicronema sp. CCY15110]
MGEHKLELPNIDPDVIRQQARQVGFHHVGIAQVDHSQTAAIAANTALQSWLHQGYQADMAWMNNPKRQDIQQVMPGARSLICVALNYYTPQPHSDDPQSGKISRYGWGRDYHRVMQKKLKTLSEWLRSHHPDIQTRFYVDTGPVSDKFWAQQAGIGWLAKNGNVITRDYGSWVFLGEILTNLELPADPPHTEHCGTCTRCLDACPTGAIAAPFVVDANRCIAYHTIENRDPTLPPEIAQNLHGWVAGCDICQDVCPWNQRFAQPTDMEDFQPYPDNVAPNLAELANLSEADWNRRFPASALRRIKPAMWRRNARAAQQSQPS